MQICIERHTYITDTHTHAHGHIYRDRDRKRWEDGGTIELKVAIFTKDVW